MRGRSISQVQGRIGRHRYGALLSNTLERNDSRLANVVFANVSLWEKCAFGVDETHASCRLGANDRKASFSRTIRIVG